MEEVSITEGAISFLGLVQYGPLPGQIGFLFHEN